MTMTLGTDTGFYRGLTLEETLARLAALGWRDVQVSAGHLASAENVREVCERLGVSVRQVHCDEELGPEPSHVDAQLAWLRRAADLGARCLITHASGNADYHTEEQRRRCLAINRGCLETIAPRARELGVRVAVENRLERPWATCKRFGARMADLLQLTDVPGCDHLGVCLDTSHTRVSRLSFSDEIAQCGARLFATQVSDSDGETQHRMPFTLDVDWHEVVSALKRIDYDGLLCLDVGADRDKSLDDLDTSLAACRDRFATLL